MRESSLLTGYRLINMKRKIVIIGGIGLILVCAVATWVAGGVLSSPAPWPIGDLPADLTGRPIQFASASGETIHGWLIPGRKGAGAIALLHGLSR